MNYAEIKVGDYLLADNDGVVSRGEVTDLNNQEKQVCIDNGVQEFWFEANQLSPIAITDEELSLLKFHKHVNDDGTIKYAKGAFRMLIPKDGDFSRMELWYRDETRHIATPISISTLQNHFYEMTKVLLNNESFD